MGSAPFLCIYGWSPNAVWMTDAKTVRYLADCSCGMHFVRSYRSRALHHEGSKRVLRGFQTQHVVANA